MITPETISAHNLTIEEFARIRQDTERHIGAATETLGAAAEPARTEGRRLSFEAAVELALS